MGLARYQAKRNFKKTPEPAGGRKKTSSNKVRNVSELPYVIQKHDASHLHYDFRLQAEGVLKSWAVPKGPSLDPAVKRLAIEVEDHPIEYAKFEGIIPEPEYGAGSVIVWDRGKWKPKSSFAEGYKKGHLEFSLEGDKLHGNWQLVRTGRQEDAKKPQWLLIKKNDEFAVKGDADALLTERAESVVSGRTLEDLKKKGGKKLAPPPEFVKPQLATLVDSPPSTGTRWAHEIKFDGYRTQARIDRGKVRLLTRTGLDWSAKYRALQPDLLEIRAANAVLDGEVVWLDEKGKSQFQGLQLALKDADAAAPVYYYVFDLLFLNGEDLREQPLEKRKEALRKILPTRKDSRVRYSDHWTGSGEDFLGTCCKMSLEGMVSKDLDAAYVSARTRSWLKIKCLQKQEFVIGGYTDPEGARKGFGSLLLGYHDKEGTLRYAGKVGTGFNDRLLRDLHHRLKQLETEAPPFSAPVPRSASNHWVQPKLVAEVSFTEWTSEGILRHPSFNGLREDKPAVEVKKEDPVKPNLPAQTLTHPDKILYPEQGITKRQLADYLQTMSGWILPHVRNRPLSLVRCPEGADDPCFFQKHLHRAKVPGIHTAKIERNGDTYMSLDTAEGLVSLAQIGVLEIHVWGCHAPKIESPDLLVFDLDPGPGRQWKDVVNGAFELRDLLERLSLESFLKVTGGKGLHLHVPIVPKYDWEMAKTFTKAVADEMVRQQPTLYTSALPKKHREGKIFIDYLRNGFGATAVAPYSMRAKPNASVAVPITWAQLKKGISPDEFTIQNTPEIVRRRKKDPWEGYFELQQTIPLLEEAQKKKAA